MSENLKNAVASLRDEDINGIREAINTELLDRAYDAIQTRKIEVGQSMFASDSDEDI